VTCEVCGAPALAIDGACPFCHSPLERSGGGEGLLDYLAAHVPAARARRNLLGRGPVRRFELTAAGTLFKGRLRKDELEVEPRTDPAAWSARLVSALARDATSDHELRRALSRSGWALTPLER
jgi:hypothetical protein